MPPAASRPHPQMGVNCGQSPLPYRGLNAMQRVYISPASLGPHQNEGGGGSGGARRVCVRGRGGARHRHGQRPRAKRRAPEPTRWRGRPAGGAVPCGSMAGRCALTQAAPRGSFYQLRTILGGGG